jgi:hypothetical protein
MFLVSNLKKIDFLKLLIEKFLKSKTMMESENNNDINLEIASKIILEDIISKYDDIDWNEKCSFEYNTYSYKFNNDEIIVDIHTRIYEEKILSRVILNQEVLLSKAFQIENGNVIKKIDEYIHYIYNLTYNYNYSRILDSLVIKELQEKEEKKAMAKIFIKHDTIENCCACMEQNTVLTRCGHNLCRICLSKMYKNKKHVNCPLCRKCLCPACEEDDENDE